MSTTTPSFNTEVIGQWTEPLEFVVTRERIQSYAAATNDPIAPHMAGDYAPPVFAIVPAFQSATGAALKVVPQELMMMIVHGEQDFRFHAAILPDTTVRTRAAAIGVHPRSSGVTVTVKAETHGQDGQLLVEQYMTTFVRGAQGPEAVGEAAPGHAFDASLRRDDPIATTSQRFDEDQTFRYAEASGDPMPIHLDDALAKSMGLPGIIIHGLCTMAFTSVAVIEHACPDDPTRLERLAVRFAKPLTPGQTITTSVWSKAPNVLAYETVADDDAVAIKDGLAEIRDRATTA